VYESEFARVGLVAGTNVVLFQQSSRPIPTSELEATWAEIEASFVSLERSAHVLMLDVRKTRGRNDAEFERVFAPYRARMAAGWKRVGIVVTSPSGVLQVQRYAREDKIPLKVFDDADAAFLWLQETG
jgi:hypothetical protein